MKKRYWFMMLMLVTGIVFEACGRYEAVIDGAKCQTIADCNPGKECGELISCVQGKCDPNQIIKTECQIDCDVDHKCPEGMHCRYDQPLPKGVCVVNGSCEYACECVGTVLFEQPECTGRLVCDKGSCGFECLDDCEQASDCMLTDRGPCCGFEENDYVAIRSDRLQDYRFRTMVSCESDPINCLEIACVPPDGLEVDCRDKQCVTKTKDDDWFQCHEDKECITVHSDCSCGCNPNASGEIAINKKYLEDYRKKDENFCATVGVCPPDLPNACTNRPAFCGKGHCYVLGENCGCQDLWDPVCVRYKDDSHLTIPNECQADCLGLPIYYHGRCDCQMDCDCGDNLYNCSACARNGITYSCGVMEAECNGQEILYPGSCDPNCDYCNYLNRMPEPVCGSDFFDYAEWCFAECLGRDYWHYGSCLEGEGRICGTIAGISCSTEELYCLLEEPCCDFPGVCIAVGHCLKPEDCQYQPLDRPKCPGQWSCKQHSCKWQCVQD